MSSLKRNALANYAGKIWGVLLSVLLVPVYIRILGLDAYGLIGFFAVLMAAASLLDVGLSATMNREMARSRVLPNSRDEANDLARTLIFVYWVIGLVIGFGIYCSSSWIANNWLGTGGLPMDAVAASVAMMGASLALQWPISLYSGGINGLERQVSCNAVLVILGTVRNLGAVLVLVVVSPSITAYFAWQMIASALSVAAFGWLFWHVMPSGTRKPKLNFPLLKGVWGFATGMAASGIVTFLLSQLDKLILSKVLSLTHFGHYNIANQINVVTKMSPASIFSALLPKLTSLYAKQDVSGFARLYSLGCQLVAIVTLPASFVVAAFSYDIIRIWTGSVQIAESSACIASVLIIGSAFNSIMGIPYTATIAAGWATFGLYQNAISAVMIVPLMLVLTNLYGGMGAAFSWLILNLGYIAVSPIFIHRRVLAGNVRDWYLVDVGRPLVISSLVVICAKLALPSDMDLILFFFSLAATWAVAAIACVCTLPEMRIRALDYLAIRKVAESGAAQQ